MTMLDAPVLRDLASHLIEYPAGSGRMYHRHEDGAVLRLEAKLSDGWHDLTCDAAEIAIQWGDTNGDDLTPYSDAGQCNIILKDLDGRYGPLPPTGFPLFTRWCPVRVWVGHVSDPDDMPVDTTTRYGLPGTYGGTPPEVYGGTARTAQADGISCRFSGWLMSQTRTPESTEAVTTWDCGDGMVRLVDQDVRDYDVSLTPGVPVTDADWPPGLRENAPGNYRVGQLVSFVHGPTGEPYGVVSTAAPTSPMMQSPGGKVGDLIHRVAEADLSFFWWQPDVSPDDHDTPRDWYGYRTFDWLSSHGLEWPIQCDGVHGYDGTLVSDDRSFYSAVRAAKGMTKRTVWTPQPPWSGFAFDSSVAKIIGSASFKAQPGEQFSFKVQMDLNCDKASIEYWVRITGTDLIKVGENTVSRNPTIATVVTAASSAVEIDPTTPPDTMVEVQIRARSLAPVLAPGYLATNVWFVLSRNSKTGPEVLVDDPTLADEAEIHEYAKTDLMLRQQADVASWANWVVTRSKTNRWIMESVSEDPGLGAPAWSWGMWHSAWLGDRANLEIPDGGELHTESQWIRGLEFRIADTLTLTMHLETVPAFGLSMDLRVAALDHSTTSPSIPIPGGRIVPNYESRPELPGWDYRQAGEGLIIGNDGTLEWGASDIWPIRTDDPPGRRVEIQKQPAAFNPEIRFYEPGPTTTWDPHTNAGNRSATIRLEDDALVIYPPQTTIEGSDPTIFGELYLNPNLMFMEVDKNFADDDADFPGGSTEGWMQVECGEFNMQSMLAAYGPATRAAQFIAEWSRSPDLIQAGVIAQRGDKSESITVTPVVLLADATEGGTTLYGSVEIHLDPQADAANRVQWFHQVGVSTVSFIGGAGLITVPVAMGGTRVPQAQIVGTTVGGPMVAQVNAPDAHTLAVYLADSYDGSLDVSWMVEHTSMPPPPVPPTLHVYSAHVSGTSGSYIIYDIGGADVTIDILGSAFVSGSLIADSSGVVTPDPTFNSSTSLTWTVHADDFAAGVDHTYHVVNPDTTVSNDFTLHWVDTAPEPPPFGGDTIGLAVGAISMPLEQVQGVSDDWIAAQADALLDLGVGWQRGDYPASMTNPSSGTYDFTDADRWVIAAIDRGIRPLPILYQLPSWMNGSDNDKTPPLDDADYATWCAAACDHLWGLGVRAVELWNEQNLNGFWNSPSNSDADTRQRYVTMIQAAYTAIKAVTPDMVVVSGGLSTSDSCWNTTLAPDPPGKGALSTIQRYGELGLFDYCDAVGWHPYLDDDRPCEDVGGWPAWNLGSVQAALTIIDTYASGRDLQIWTTETGCPRSAVGGSESAQAGVAQDAYAAYLDDGCLGSVRSRLGPFFWFCVADRTVGDGREDSFGFMDSTLTTRHSIYDQMKTYWMTAWPS